MPPAFRAFVGALLALLLLPVTSARAEPALWIVRDADSTIYLFGTVHALKESGWLTPKIRSALASSQELWLETAGLDDPVRLTATLTAQMKTRGFAPQRRLSAVLSADELESFKAAVAHTGMPFEYVDAMRPWLAALAISEAAMLRGGYESAMGADNVLTATARRWGKPVRGLESLDQHFGILSGMSEEAQLAFLRQTLMADSHALAMLDILMGVWMTGDVEALERDFLSDMDEPAEFHEALLVRRNRAWTEAILERLKGKGVSFYAVGAAHLAGPDNVRTMLAARGVHATRH